MFIFPVKWDVLGKYIVGNFRKSTEQPRVRVMDSGLWPEPYFADLPGQTIWGSLPKLISTRNLQGVRPRKKLNLP